MGLIMRDSVPYAGSNDIVLTQAQYDALVQAGEVLPNVNYYISNANHSTPVYASGVHYDNSDSGLVADDVQEAIDEVNSNLIAATNTVTTLTLNAKVTYGGNLFAYRMGKLILITGYILPQSNWATETVIATISGITLVQTLFATPAKQETGTADRVLAVNGNNEISIKTETAWGTGYFRSFTMFGFLN